MISGNEGRDANDLPKLRICANINEDVMIVIDCPHLTHKIPANSMEQFKVKAETCRIKINRREIFRYKFKSGGVYLFLLYQKESSEFMGNVVSITPNWNMDLWLIVLVLIVHILCKSIIFVFGLCWIYIQAPVRLKSMFVQCFFSVSLSAAAVEEFLSKYIADSTSIFTRYVYIFSLTLIAIVVFTIMMVFYDAPDLTLDHDNYSEEMFFEESPRPSDAQ